MHTRTGKSSAPCALPHENEESVLVEEDVVTKERTDEDRLRLDGRSSDSCEKMDFGGRSLSESEDVSSPSDKGEEGTVKMRKNQSLSVYSAFRRVQALNAAWRKSESETFLAGNPKFENFSETDSTQETVKTLVNDCFGEKLDSIEQDDVLLLGKEDEGNSDKDPQIRKSRESFDSNRYVSVPLAGTLKFIFKQQNDVSNRVAAKKKLCLAELMEKYSCLNGIDKLSDSSSTNSQVSGCPTFYTFESYQASSEESVIYEFSDDESHNVHTCSILENEENSQNDRKDLLLDDEENNQDDRKDLPLENFSCRDADSKSVDSENLLNECLDDSPFLTDRIGRIQRLDVSEVLSYHGTDNYLGKGVLCPLCDTSIQYKTQLVAHLRKCHDSKWPPPKELPIHEHLRDIPLVHCSCGLVLLKDSLLTHQLECHCLKSLNHRKFGPHNYCECLGCETPTELSACNPRLCRQLYSGERKPTLNIPNIYGFPTKWLEKMSVCIPITVFEGISRYIDQPIDVHVGKHIRKGDLNKYISCVCKVFRSYREYFAKQMNHLLLQHHLSLFMLMPKLLLRNTEKGESRSSLFQLFDKGEILSLFRRALKFSSKRKFKSGKNGIQKRVAKLVTENRLRNACEQLMDQKFADFSEDTFKVLQQKFPKRKFSLGRYAPQASEITISKAEVIAAAKKINPFSGVGLSGTPMSSLILALRKPDGIDDADEYAEHIAFLVSMVARGCEHTRLVLSATKLIALEKKDGGLRPVNIPEALRRLVARVLSNRAMPQFRSAFGNLQLGLARNGVDSAVHTVRYHLKEDTNNFAVFLDFANAFNEISRSQIQEVIANRFPEWLPFFELFHVSPTDVHFHHKVIHAEEGTLQGDNWGGMFFAIGIHPILQRLRVSYPEFKLIAYYDDITVLGHVNQSDRLSSFLEKFVKLFHEVGLQVKLSKSAVYTEDGSLDLSKFDVLRHLKLPSYTNDEVMVNACLETSNGIQVVNSSSGIEFLGSPIGGEAWVSTILEKQTTNVKKYIKALERILDMPQHAVVLLRSCVNTKLNHLARTVFPDRMKQWAVEHDHEVNLFLRKLLPQMPEPVKYPILEVPLAYRKARLPTTYGGLGIRSLYMSLEGAFMASSSASYRIVHGSTVVPGVWVSEFNNVLTSFKKCLDVVNTPCEDLNQTWFDHQADWRKKKYAEILSFPRARRNDKHNADANPRCEIVEMGKGAKPQKKCAEVVESWTFDKTLRDVYNSTNPLSRYHCARFLASSCKDAVVWCNTTPTKPELEIEKTPYLLLLAHLLNVRLPRSQFLPSSCICPDRCDMDINGYHVLACRKELTEIHMLQEIHNFAVAAGVKTNFVQRSSGKTFLSLEGLFVDDSRVLVDFVAVDVTSDDAMNYSKSYTDSKSTLMNTDEARIEDFWSESDVLHVKYIPLAIEITGQWSARWKKLFKAIIRCGYETGRFSDTPRAEGIAYWRQRLSVQFKRSLGESAVQVLHETLGNTGNVENTGCRIPMKQFLGTQNSHHRRILTS